MAARPSVRVWVDGCFDMMHFGHANAMRQAKAMGDVLIVGVHSDEEITRNKGPTVMNNAERYLAVRACKWVDDVVEDAPYVTQMATLDEHHIDFVVHGDDITTNADGVDAYHIVKAAGRYRECKRTEGVSTTDLVGRMLLCTRDHLNRHLGNSTVEILAGFRGSQLADFSSASGNVPATRVSHFLAGTSQLVQLSPGRAPQDHERIVYVDGAFDLFHVGHIEFLKHAKVLGHYLIVGVHEDEAVNRVRGSNNPIMALHERVLGVLSCRYVDHVVLGAPYTVTEPFLGALGRIDIVAHGSTDAPPDVDGKDPYEVPKQRGIFKVVATPHSMVTTTEIIGRIIEHRLVYEERNRRKLNKAETESKLKAQELQTAAHP